MKPHSLYTTDTPAPIGPYSQVVQAGDLIFISGQIFQNVLLEIEAIACR